MKKFKIVLPLIAFSLFFDSCTATKPWTNDKNEKRRGKAPVSSASVEYSLFLIGDTGEPVLDGDDPVLILLKEKLQQAGEKSSIVFLGDNIYLDGMEHFSEEAKKNAEAKLVKTLSSMHEYAGRAFFIAGNHDWHSNFKGLQLQEKFINSYNGVQNLSFHPKSGCPGPEEVINNDRFALVLMDSEWFLIKGAEEYAKRENCSSTTAGNAILELRRLAYKHRDKTLVVAVHHPLFSNGRHAGNFTAKQHFFPLTELNKKLWVPLPGLGSIYVLLRKLGVSNEDFGSKKNRAYRESIINALADHPNAITAAGHDHNLQYFDVNGISHIVSGSGSKTSKARKGKDAKFVFSGKGFAVINFYNDGTAWLEMWTAEKPFSNNNPVYRVKIHGETSKPDENVAGQELLLPDSVAVSTDSRYDIGFFGRTILGGHYRQSWIMPVKYPVLNLREDKGGLKIKGMGGGFQTTTFFLENTHGEGFVMRSIPKDPTENLPKILQRTFIRDLLQDQISASNPFGPLIVSPMASAAGIYYTIPEAYYLLDDPAFGRYRGKVKNQAVLLEEFVNPSLIRERFGDDATGTVDTEELMEILYDNPKHKIDGQWYLRSRLMDMILNDWDRHEGQFFWASMEEDDGFVTYRAFPIDRDNVIFKMDGLLPHIANRKWAMRRFQHFDYDIRDIAGMNFQAQHLDRRALAELEKKYWIDIANHLRESLSDESIEKGVRYLPDPVFERIGEEVIDKLKSRRDKVVEFAGRYYEYVSKELEIVGTRLPELFVIDEIEGTGKLLLRRYGGLKESEGQLVFERVIDPEETKEVRMYGVSGEDHFLFKNRNELPVKFQVVSGADESELTRANSNRRSAQPVVMHSKKIKGLYLKEIKPNMGEFTTKGIEQYGYNYQEYAFDFIAPALQFSLNKDDGVFLGGGFAMTKHGFRKYPYAARHRFTSSVASSKLSYNLLYEGEFIHFFGYTDLLVDALIQSPHFQRNYFGLGNETKRAGDDRFHDIRQDVYSLNPILKYRIVEQSEILFGPTFDVVDVRKSAGKFIATPQAGLDQDNFKTFKILGFKSTYAYNNVTDPLYPRNGFSFEGGGHFTVNLDDDESLFKLALSASLYHTIKNTDITFATRIGGAGNFGNYRFFQANTIGGTGPLLRSKRGVFDQGNFRGVLRDRFSGKTAFYQNTEIRWKLLDINSFFIPGTLGILGLVDHGRVWIPNENSDTWHYAAGGGLWYNFYGRVIVNVTYGNSDVDDSFSLILGFLF